MSYWHEQQERKPNANPLNTDWPARDRDSKAVRAYLESRNLDAKLAESNGWYQSSHAGDYCLRVVIPAVTHVAGHVYFQARDITGRDWLRYQSPKGPRHESFIAVKPKGKPKGVVVLEGPCCALRAAMHGYLGIALMGMAPNQATLLHIALYVYDAKKLVLVLLDRDSGAAATKVATFLAAQGLSTKVGQFTKSKDLAELSVKESEKLLRGYFKQTSRCRKKSSARQK